jgi:hypothetical protein
MKLLDKATETKFSRSNAGADSVARSKQEVLAKFFDPCGRWTYYVLEAEVEGNDWRLYGWCVSPLGPDCDEYGYMMLSEIASVKNRLGLGMERDRGFSGTLNEALGVAA